MCNERKIARMAQKVSNCVWKECVKCFFIIWRNTIFPVGFGWIARHRWFYLFFCVACCAMPFYLRTNNEKVMNKFQWFLVSAHGRMFQWVEPGEGESDGVGSKSGWKLITIYTIVGTLDNITFIISYQYGPQVLFSSITFKMRMRFRKYDKARCLLVDKKYEQFDIDIRRKLSSHFNLKDFE